MSATSERTPRHEPNVPALIALFCGIASWVPLIIVITGPLTFAFGAWGWARARKRAARKQAQMATWGMALAIMATALQLGIAAFAGGIGALGGLLGVGS